VFARISSAGTVAWYLPDRLGSVRDIANDSTGAVIDHIDYDGFGNATETQPTNGDRYKWTGGELDSETGLYHFDWRYYDPKVGRWTAQDPSDLAAGDSNLYRYVGNDPIGATDPSGLQDSPFGEARIARIEMREKEIARERKKRLGNLQQIGGEFKSWVVFTGDVLAHKQKKAIMEAVREAALRIHKALLAMECFWDEGIAAGVIKGENAEVRMPTIQFLLDGGEQRKKRYIDRLKKLDRTTREGIEIEIHYDKNPTPEQTGGMIEGGLGTPAYTPLFEKLGGLISWLGPITINGANDLFFSKDDNYRAETIIHEFGRKFLNFDSAHDLDRSEDDVYRFDKLVDYWSKVYDKECAKGKAPQPNK
jgi:RHS repeat-associated protein